MKNLFFLAIALLLLAAFCPPVCAQGTAFTYQGRLNSGGGAASGSYDFRFRLATDPLGNNGYPATFLTNGIVVTNGLFTTTIDFGTGQFIGSTNWLEVDVRTNGAGSYTALIPLQAFTPTPYAIFANTASNVSGTISAAQISGTVASGNLPASPTVSGTVTAGAFAGNGASVTNVNAASVNGLNASNFWQMGGNNVAAGQFLGSTTSQPLELRANGIRVLKIDAAGLSGKAVNGGFLAPNGSPNMIGGAPANYVAPAVVGATIGGGGAMNYFTLIYSNSVAADFGTIGGGANNSIQSTDYGYTENVGVIGGGENNTIMSNSPVCVISGGARNTIHTNSYNSFIGGGVFNSIAGRGATIVGGGYDGATFGGNRVDADGAAIVGGVTNIIYAGAKDAFIGGGWSNNIQSGAIGAVIAGGFENVAAGNYSFAAGQQSQALQSGAFVWADSQNSTFASTASNQFLIRAQGNVGINTNNPTSTLTVNGQLAATSLRAPGAGINSGTFAFTHRAVSTNTSGYITVINNPLTDNDPNAIVIITHNWTADTNSSSQYVTTPVGVFYASPHWEIFYENQSGSMLGHAFNVLVIKP